MASLLGLPPCSVIAFAHSSEVSHEYSPQMRSWVFTVEILSKSLSICPLIAPVPPTTYTVSVPRRLSSLIVACDRVSKRVKRMGQSSVPARPDAPSASAKSSHRAMMAYLLLSKPSWLIAAAVSSAFSPAKRDSVTVSPYLPVQLTEVSESAASAVPGATSVTLSAMLIASATSAKAVRVRVLKNPPPRFFEQVFCHI